MIPRLPETARSRYIWPGNDEFAGTFSIRPILLFLGDVREGFLPQGKPVLVVEPVLCAARSSIWSAGRPLAGGRLRPGASSGEADSRVRDVRGGCELVGFGAGWGKRARCSPAVGFG